MIKKLYTTGILVLTFAILISLSAPGQVDAASLLTSNQGSTVASTALQYVNKVDYLRGGYTSATRGLDNVGFVKYVYAKYNVSVPYSLNLLAKTGLKVSTLQKGDVLFFTNKAKTAYSFVGIYVGSGYFVGASAAFDGVVLKKISNYSSQYYGARRMYQPTNSTTSGSYSTTPDSNSTTSNSNSTTSSSYGAKIVDEAKDYLGVPYVFSSSATTTSSFDCSSFVQRSVYDAGLGKLPRTARAQASYMANNAQYVSSSQLKAGDLLFWKNMGDHVAAGVVSHVGIYIGNNKFIHCLPNKGVIITSFSSYYTSSNRTAGAYRFTKKIS